ncbi:MAG: hypothetical protein GY953_41735, partial [bacterium]|nr:hypothetical protein [bacterium]
MSRNVVLSLAGLLLLAGLAPAEVMTFRVVFGETADRPTDYSGSIALSSGEIVRIEPWRFLEGDSIDGNSWKLSVKRVRFEDQPDVPRPMMTGAMVMNVVPAGIVVTVDAPETASARLRAGGEVAAFPLRSLKTVPVFPMARGDILVERVPTVERVSAASERDPVEHFDYPSTVETSDGDTWVAWQGYHDRGDHVYARRKTASGWGEVEQLTQEKGDVFRTAIGEDSAGRLWVVWAQRMGTEWDLYARRRNADGWAPRVKITSANYPNTFHRLVTDRERNLHLVWVGHTGGQSFVYWSRLRGDSWSSPMSVSGPSAWNPEAAADSQGNLWVTWDGYRSGNYDIYLRKITADGELAPEQQVTKSALF